MLEGGSQTWRHSQCYVQNLITALWAQGGRKSEAGSDLLAEVLDLLAQHVEADTEAKRPLGRNK